MLVKLLIAFLALSACTRQQAVPDDAASQPGPMTAALDVLYKQAKPAEAVYLLTRILVANPNHYGARFQLAVALERSGDRYAAKAEWAKVRAAAEAIQDRSTASIAEQHLQLAH